MRTSARAVLLDPQNRILLCRMRLPVSTESLWIAPGGGIRDSEEPVDALRRELLEEVGYFLNDTPPLIWIHEVKFNELEPARPFKNLFFLIRTNDFFPESTLGRMKMLGEGLVGCRWWTVSELLASSGKVLFGPPSLPELVKQLIAYGAPTTPVQIAAQD